jgi:hypothetical protein
MRAYIFALLAVALLASPVAAEVYVNGQDVHQCREEMAIIGHGVGATKTVTTIVGNSLGEVTEVTDELYMHWVFPDNLDFSRDLEIHVEYAPGGSEGSKNISFDLACVTMDGLDDISATTGTEQVVDSAIPATVNLSAQVSFDLSAATYLPAMDLESVHCRLTRVAASADPTADIIVLHAEVIFWTRG